MKPNFFENNSHARKTFKTSLRLSYLYLISSFVFFVLINLYILNLKDLNLETRNEINRLETQSLLQFKNQQEFIFFGAKDTIFYKTFQSKYITINNELNESIQNRLQSLSKLNSAISITEDSIVTNLLRLQTGYNKTFNDLIIEILNRGYKEYGTEGKMRQYAHQLMEIETINQTNILLLRRHEKDFIIRKEKQYVSKFNQLVGNIEKEIAQKNKFDNSIGIIQILLSNYQKNFNQLVKSEDRLYGLNNGIGLYHKLHTLHNSIEENYSHLNKELVADYYTFIIQTITYSLAITLLIIFAIYYVSNYFTKKLTDPLIDINSYIREFVDNDYKEIPSFKKATRITEFISLYDSFHKMSKEIMDYISKIDIKVKERTATIEKQFNEIEKQRFELTQTNYKLVENNIELKKSKKVIEQKNEEILDSLRYAQRIQRTLMPSLNFLKTKVPNSFIYFLPKDIVSGDFYFIHESEEMLFIAIADCTGHGVPGAFMSFIAIHALQREIIDKKETDTGKILTGVNKTMNNDSKNDSEQIYDGMDIALCCINRKTNELSFSGANIPIWITSFSKHYSSNEKNCYSVKTNSTNLYLTEIKADKQPIGRYINSIDFSTTKMQLVANDHFYIFTDGYADQFGGVNGKKYKYSNLRKLLVAIKEKDIDEQKKAIREDFTNWKNKLEQLDDICVFGYEIN